VKDIDNPILGFEVRNKLGIELFGYNTSFSEPGLPPLRRGQPLTAVFRFTWPHLVTGAYSVNLALADDENGTIVQHHYVNDALIIESLMSVNMTGLMGLPDMVVEVGPARA
ncbi:MAG: Wzt carbohydrate-binding domain-containing protein, partial [Desulfohalobiaceae bacterium]